MFTKLKVKYSLEEAKTEIDRILKKYGDKCEICFLKTNAEITNSYLVTSSDDRHLICEIIARTGITKRNYEDLSAEWKFHNVAYAAHIKRDSAKDVNLDYEGDPRASVKVVTRLFDNLDIE